MAVLLDCAQSNEQMKEDENIVVMQRKRRWGKQLVCAPGETPRNLLKGAKCHEEV